MKFQLVFTITALEELDDIVEYIAKDSAVQAEKYRDRVMKIIRSLMSDPYLGRSHTVKKYSKLGLRELIVESHVAHYKVYEEKNEVVVYRILHAAMNQVRHLKETKFK